MEYVTSIFAIGESLWNCFDADIGYIRDFEENLESLKIAIKDLKNLSEDVKRKVEMAARYQLQSTKEVQSWFEAVEDRERKASEIMQRAERRRQKKCLGACAKNCLGKAVFKELSFVKELINKGHFDAVSDSMPSARVEKPVDKTINMEVNIEKVCGWLEDPNVGMVGIYGVGGIGKTTLLKKINNRFLAFSHGFDMVIWALVSRDANMEKIQDVIGNKLGISDSKWVGKTDDEKAEQIFNILKTKRFVLLLDDLWEGLDLLKAGVPIPDDENCNKIVFTTRSEEICGQMGAQKRLRVAFLSGEEAMDLFLRKVGKDTLNLHPDMRILAEIIVDECKGLPLALITVAGAMATRKKPEEWKHAINVLRNHPSLFPGMKGHVFDILMFSYHSLSNETLKRCFRYCCIFPEDHEFHKYDIIHLWIAEGFLDVSNFYEARNHGEYIIGSLKQACLLESGESENHFRMHDVVRDMAMSLAWREYDNILVQGRDGVTGVRDSSGEEPLRRPRRMSFWGLDSKNVVTTKVSHELQTLLVRNCQLNKLPEKWFKFTDNCLSVLDLSHNSFLTEVPAAIGSLFLLRHLNLSWTSITKLPGEVKNLANLEILLMDGTLKLKTIPTKVISHLASLQVFSRILHTEDSVTCLPLDRITSLEEFECLVHLDFLGASLGTIESIQHILNSPRFQRCISFLTIMECSDLSSLCINDTGSGGMEHLEKLQVRACHSFKELKIIQEQKKPEGFVPDNIPRSSTFTRQGFFQSLSHVEFWDCPVRDMTWLVHAPRVQTLKISNCHSIVEVIGDNSGSIRTEQKENMFSCLKDLTLKDLPKLRTISRQALPFPFLVRIRVVGCPNLRKLPLNSKSARNSLMQICGEESWWDQLLWKHEATKHIFSSKFVKLL